MTSGREQDVLISFRASRSTIFFLFCGCLFWCLLDVFVFISICFLGVTGAPVADLPVESSSLGN